MQSAADVVSPQTTKSDARTPDDPPSEAPTPGPTDREALMATVVDELGTLIVEAKRTVADAAARFDPEVPVAAFYVLRYVMVHGPCPAGDVVKHLTMDKSAVSRLVAGLRETAHLTATPDADDGRVTMLSATEKAQERYAEVRRGNRELFRDRVDAWTTDELRAFAAVLARFNAPA